MSELQVGWVLWVVWTVRAVWVLATAACLLASDLPVVSVEALRRAAHYGKLQSEVAALAPVGAFQAVQARLVSMSLPPRAVWSAYYGGGALLNAACLFLEPCGLLALLHLHLLRRIYETRCVTVFSQTRREHPLTVCVGAFFYFFLSPSLALEVRVARLRRGDSSITSDSSGLTGLHRPGEVEAEEHSFLSILCLISFAFANIAQNIAHRQLAGLRPPSSRAAQSVSGKLDDAKALYSVPDGWLFRNISCCPHYSAEVLVYATLAVFATSDARGGRGGFVLDFGGARAHVCVSAVLAAIFSFVNLSITAVRTRKWYRKQKDAAHLSTAAIIPWIL